MSAEDIGIQLATLVHHLFQVYTPEKAFFELTLRTGVEGSREDNAKAKSVAGLSKTSWYAEMGNRYASMLAKLRDSRKADFEEVSDVVKSLYPSGCAVSDYADAVQTCAAMVTFTIPNDLILSFIDEQSDNISARGVHELSLDDLTNTILDGLLIQAMIPHMWWRSAAGASSIKVRRIGLCAEPLQIAIEYEWPPTVVRHRRIPLDTLLPPTGPTGPLAKRLSPSHDALVEETELQRLLMKLQYIQQKADDQNNKPEESPVTASTMNTRQVSSSDSSSSEDDAAPTATVQKADLGLLYRDPEKALQNVDLNDADEVTLKEFKDVMNEKFKAIAIKPGDPGYVYDKRVETAAPTQDSVWDDSDDD